MTEQPLAADQAYLDLIVRRINVCKLYQPRFGQGRPTSLAEFTELYGSDPFYSWFGLDNPLMYAAHRAAGGITSLYRQLGIGCEQLFRQIIQDQFDLSMEQASWSYTVQATGRKSRTLSLDGRITIQDLQSDEHQERVSRWIADASRAMNINPNVAQAFIGSVFEVRQGYKSKDSKRQNADIGNAGTATQQGYLPVIVVLSTQIDSDVANRYAEAGWLVLRGNVGASATSSTYAFAEQVLGYDLGGFFQRNSPYLKTVVEDVLKTLLSPEASPEDSTGVGLEVQLEAADELESAEDIEGDDYES